MNNYNKSPIPLIEGNRQLAHSGYGIDPFWLGGNSYQLVEEGENSINRRFTPIIADFYFHRRGALRPIDWLRASRERRELIFVCREMTTNKNLAIADNNRIKILTRLLNR